MKCDLRKYDLSALVPVVGVGFFILFMLFLIPNSPKIITNPNQPSIQRAKMEPEILKVKNSLLRQSLGIFEVTAYCPCEKCCGEYADGITANGHTIQLYDRFCAADPVIPFGKYLDIPGYGYVPVWDRGGAIRGAKLDVFFSTHQEALEWGRQELEIFCWVEGE